MRRLITASRDQWLRPHSTSPDGVDMSSSDSFTTHNVHGNVADTRDRQWPAEPYKGLATYSASDRLLFSGREDDIQRCMARLTSNSTRILMIHGHTGCGKSSFLRAGLIPRMEEATAGHLFLRDAEGQPLFIRSGADPLARLAERIYAFASEPIEQQSADGPYRVHPGDGWRLEATNVSEYIARCRQPGAFCESLQSLMMTDGLFSTLYVVLDQVEEVITLADADSDADLQFFRFVREFGMFEFPLKMVFALRKDYSGQVIEMAQVAGGIDLRRMSSTHHDFREAEHDRRVGQRERRIGQRERRVAQRDPRAVDSRADVKLYLLREFDKAKVQSAIELPTLTHFDKMMIDLPPFDIYRFRYAEGVARRITEDLFGFSPSAILPAMQIVCRDLFEASRAGARKGHEEEVTQPIALIDADLYQERGEIAGPVDRHIANSLKACFDDSLGEDGRNEEEVRWREVLLKLVNHESDGSVHTKQLSTGEFAAAVAEQGCLTSVEQAVAYLEKPDVLLLRRVQSEQGTEPLTNFCLGHDFLAMVLDRWKIARQAESIARDELEESTRKALAAAHAEAKERENRRVRRERLAAGIAGAALAGVIVLAGAVFAAAHVGQMAASVRVMSGTARALQDDKPMLASLIAARALQKADSLPLLFYPDIRRDTALALHEIVTRGPDWQSLPTTGPDSLDSPNDGVPLPVTRAFLSVNDSKAMMTLATGRVIHFELRPFNPKPDERSRFGQRVVTKVSEIGNGVAALLRVGVDGFQTSDFQVEILHMGATGSQGRVELYSSSDFEAALPNDGYKSALARNVELGRREVIVNTISERHSDIPSFSLTTVVYPLEGLGGANGPLPGQALETSVVPLSGSEGGTNFRFAALSDGIAIRRQVGSNIQTSFVDWHGKTVPLFRGGTEHSTKDAGVESYVPPCPGGCVWTLAGVATDDTALVFGAQSRAHSTSTRSTSVSWTQIASYDALLLADPAQGVAATVKTAALPSCGTGTESHAGNRRTTSALGMAEAPIADFVARDGHLGFVLGVARGAGAMDLLRVDDTGKAQCIRSISFEGELAHWAVSTDGTLLMASGPTLNAHWKLDTPVVLQRMEETKTLLAMACNAGLKQTMARDQPLFKPATHLESPDMPLCSD